MFWETPVCWSQQWAAGLHKHIASLISDKNHEDNPSPITEKEHTNTNITITTRRYVPLSLFAPQLNSFPLPVSGIEFIFLYMLKCVEIYQFGYSCVRWGETSWQETRALCTDQPRRSSSCGQTYRQAELFTGNLENKHASVMWPNILLAIHHTVKRLITPVT